MKSSKKMQLKRASSSIQEYYASGTPVWYLSGADSWLAGNVVEHVGANCRVAPAFDSRGHPLEDTEASELIVDVPTGDVRARQARSETVDDMTLLPDLNEASILHNIRQRYYSDIIYTSIGGPVLVSVNPYATRPGAYDEETRLRYAQLRRIDQAPPHIYGLTAAAYNQLIATQKSQSLLISGESGAGKTECTRHVLNFLGRTAQGAAANAATSSPSSTVSQRLMEASPVLEAFGNAKTAQNDNSSRFGKFFKVFIDRGGEVVGATVQDYLLEKSRVVQQANGERSYHAIYMLLAGASDEERQRYHLRSSPKAYQYLAGSGCFEIDNRNDAEEYVALRRSMRTVGFDEAEIDSTMRTVSAVLLLGELGLCATETGNGARLDPVSGDTLSKVSELLGVRAPHLDTVLTQRSVQARASSLYTVPLTLQEAATLRDALAKLLYARLFQWLVRRINELLSVNVGAVHNVDELAFIGVLDIFGFEIFERNSFEQLCINYANERCHQLFNKHLFVVEQDVYRAEEIRWQDVDFVSNDNCVRLLDKRPLGIFSILDEECFFPNGTDRSFLDKLVQLYKDDASFSKPKTSQHHFQVHHYAQAVLYDVTGFLEKNRDSVSESLLDMMKSSSLPFVKAMFDESPVGHATPAAGATHAPVGGGSDAAGARGNLRGGGAGRARGGAGLARGRGIGGGGVRPGGGGGARMNRRSVMPGGSVQKTLGGQFKEQLDALITNTLAPTQLRFVRCIKPNNAKRAMDFRGDSCLRQLHCAGVLDTIRVRAQGYAVRPTYDDFVQRYECLVPDASAVTHESARERADWLCDRLFVPKSSYQLGKTRVFLKQSANDLLVEKRQERVGAAAAVIERHRLAQLQRRQFVAKRRAALSLQCAYRQLCARRRLAQLRREDRARKAQQRRQAEQEAAAKRKADEEAAAKRKADEAAAAKRKADEERAAAAAAAKRRAEQEAAERAQREEEVRAAAARHMVAGPAGIRGGPGPSGEDEVPPVPDFDDVPAVPDFDEAPPPPPIPALDDAPAPPVEDDANEWRTISVGKPGEHKIKELPGAGKPRKHSLLQQATGAAPPTSRPRVDSLADYKPTNFGGFSVDGGGGNDDDNDSDGDGIDVGALNFNWGNDNDEEGDHDNEGADDEDFPAPPSPPKPAVSKVTRPLAANTIKNKLENMIAIPPPPGHGMMGGDDDSDSDEAPPKASYGGIDLDLGVGGGAGAGGGANTMEDAPIVPGLVPTGAMGLLDDIMGGGGGGGGGVGSAARSAAPASKMSAEDRLVAKLDAANRAQEDQRRNAEAALAAKRRELAERQALSASAAPAPTQTEAAALPSEKELLDSIMGGSAAAKPSLKRTSSLNHSASPKRASMAVTSGGGGGGGDDTLKFANPLFPDARDKKARAQLRQTVAYNASPDQSPVATAKPTSGGAGDGGARKDNRQVVRAADYVEIIDGVASNYCKDVKCYRLVMKNLQKPSALKIPDGAAFTKFDYTENRQHPFSFNDKPDPPYLVTPDPFPIPDDINNPVVEEPKIGLTPSDAPMKNIEKTIKNAKFQQYTPQNVFPRLPPLKKMGDIASKYKLRGLAAVSDASDKSSVRVLNLADTVITKDQLKRLPRLFEQLTSLEYLNMSACQLPKVVFVCPRLRYLDVHNNNLSDLGELIKALSKMPYLEVLKLDGNEVMRKKDAQLKLIAALPRLRRLNTLSIGAKERLEAVAKYGSSYQRKHFEVVRWDVHVSFAPELRAMGEEWDAAKLTKLNLEGCELQQFHVGLMTNLRELRLRDNAISSTLGCGLERLEKLHTLDLSKNRILKHSMFAPFSVIPRLRVLDLRENRDGKNELKDYRLLVIYATRHLKGTNRHNGLAELDGEPVSLEERVQAVEEIGKKKKNIEQWAWRVYLMDAIGHKQLRDANYVKDIRELALPSCRLRVVNLSGMRALEFLDLSGNFFKSVDGLGDCGRLRYVNLSGNSNMDLKATLAVLNRNQQRLQQLSLCVAPAGDVSEQMGSSTPTTARRGSSLSSSGTLKRANSKAKVSQSRHPDNAVYRSMVLRAVLLQNRKLDFLDNRYITLTERIETAAALTDKKQMDEVEEYRFGVGLAANCVMPIMRRLHPSDVKKGGAFDARLITSLRRMNGLGLRSKFTDFSAFAKLEELNVSNNLLTDLCAIGLDKLKYLRVLDAHGNRLKNSLDDIARLLDQFTKLECVALRENPCMQSPSHRECRFQLMGKLQCLRKVQCQLRVLDTEISVRERIQAWRKAGGGESETEALRLKAVMFLRMEPNKLPAEITSLDISNSGFPRIDLGKFVNLEVLLMRGNALSTTHGSSIEKLTKLKVLDIRENQLSVIEDVAWLIKQLPRLQTIGLSGNPFAEKKWRHELLVLLPELHERECALKMIDEMEITADEVIGAWLQNKPSKAEAKNARFRVLMLTKLPMGVRPEQMTELDLSACDLDSVALADLRALRKLSLANNNIKSLKDSQLHTLTLRALDVSHNRLASMSEFAVLLRAMPKLNVLLMHRNPMMEKDEPKTRLKWLGTLGQYFTPLTCALRLLNGAEVTIAELCDAAVSDKRFDRETIEEMRLKLVLNGRTPSGVARASYEELADGTRIVTRLNISGCGFKSLHGLRRLPHRLVALDARDNELSKMERDVFEGLDSLVELDLRNNRISSLKDILSTLKEHCPVLEVLNVEESTKNSKETAGNKGYNMKVMKTLRQLKMVDGMRNPFSAAALTITDGASFRSTPVHRTIEIRPSMLSSRGDDDAERQSPVPLESLNEDDEDDDDDGGAAANDDADLPEIDISQLKYGGWMGADDDEGGVESYFAIPAAPSFDE